VTDTSPASDGQTAATLLEIRPNLRAHRDSEAPFSLPIAPPAADDSVFSRVLGCRGFPVRHLASSGTTIAIVPARQPDWTRRAFQEPNRQDCRTGNNMNAVAFRTNLSKLLLDSRKLDWELEDLNDERDVHCESAPSPEEIRRRCLEIQKEWSPRERIKRAGYHGRLSTWSPPVVSVCEME
jgi:hypothetical protein